MRLLPLLTCREVLDRLGDDWDGTVPPGTSLVMRLHLWLCRACCKYRRSYRATARLTAALKVEGDLSPAAPLNEVAVQQIVERAQSQQSSSPRKGFRERLD
jgi:hypothetical protein